jgi:hypothetical protein
LRADGIIGRDLLVNLRATIDYGDRLLRIGLNKIPLCNPEQKIGPKSETIMQIFVDKNGEGLIEETAFDSGLFIPNTVKNVSNHKTKVLIVITTNQEISVPEIRCKLSDYTVSKIETQDLNVGNYLKLDQLQEEEKKLITDICNEFRDIFYLPGDKLTATNTRNNAPGKYAASSCETLSYTRRIQG